jgi:hypothetical protein
VEAGNSGVASDQDPVHASNLPDAALCQSRGCMHAAIKNSGHLISSTRITANLLRRIESWTIRLSNSTIVRSSFASVNLVLSCDRELYGTDDPLSFVHVAFFLFAGRVAVCIALVMGTFATPSLAEQKVAGGKIGGLRITILSTMLVSTQDGAGKGGILSAGASRRPPGACRYR